VDDYRAGLQGRPPLLVGQAELCRCLNGMVLHNRRPLCDNPHIIALASHYCQKMVDSNQIPAAKT
jgi:hypothetical protein